MVRPAHAAERLFTEWLAQRTKGASDEEAAIRQVQGFLEAHGASRFQLLRPSNNEEKQTINENQVMRRL